MPPSTGPEGRAPEETSGLVAQAREYGVVATVGLWIGVVFFVLCLASASIFENYWFSMLGLAIAAFGFGIFANYRFRLRSIKSNIERF